MSKRQKQTHTRTFTFDLSFFGTSSRVVQSLSHLETNTMYIRVGYSVRPAELCRRKHIYYAHLPSIALHMRVTWYLVWVTYTETENHASL